MSKACEYEIAVGSDVDELDAAVQALLERGFKPCGGVSSEGVDGRLFQAMIQE